MLERRTWYLVLGTQYLVLLVAAAQLVHAVSPVVAAPPKLDYLFPAGGQQGQAVAVTASGEFSAWPVQAWSDRPGIAVTADKDKGKLNFTVAADAVPGVYWLRLTNEEGASQPKPFIVGALAEVAEVETNDTPAKPQVVEPLVVINGRLARSGDVDGFQITLQQGQTLVAALQANSVLGSPMDAVMQVCELVSRSGSASGVREHPGNGISTSAQTYREAYASRSPGVEAYVLTQNHDAVGLDPQIAFTAPHAGNYLVRVFAFPATPDQSIRYAGGDAYVYRLTLTTGPYLDHVLPLALLSEETQVQLAGWNLGAAATTVVPSLANDADRLAPSGGALAWVWRPGVAGAIALPRVPHASLVAPLSLARSASEGNPPLHPELPLPSTITGHLHAPGDQHSFLFTATKDQKIHLRAEAKALGFPTDVVVAILDDSGKVLTEADDTGRDDRDPTLEFAAPASGRYRVQIRDLHGRGGERMVYRLTIEPVLPNFSLALAADSFVLEKDKPLEIPISVTVSGGLREPIEISAVGLPAGVVVEPVKYTPTEDAPQPMSRSRRRSSPPSTVLVLKVDPASFQAGGAPIRIEGRTSGQLPIVRTARFPLGLPLAGSHHAAWLTVRK